jgi:hypothetical protein
MKWPKSNERERDVFEKSQAEALERATRREKKAAKKRSDRTKDNRRETEREWPARLEWYYSSHMPGYWVI